MTKPVIYAIDFGTSNSLLSAVQNNSILGLAPLEPNAEETTILRSIMFFNRSNKTFFGHQAIQNYGLENGDGRFLRSIKKYLPYNSFTGTQINNNFYPLEDLISRFLREMKNRADAFYNVNCSTVLLGRPAQFSLKKENDDLAEKRLLKAAQLAGFKQIYFLPEPLAAAYEFKKTITQEKIVLVVDLGGGTSDFTVIKLHPGKYSSKDVLGIGGVPVAGNKLDGSIMSEKIAPHLGSKVSYKMPLSSNVLTMPPVLKHSLMSPADIVLMSRKNIMSFLQQVKKCTLKESDKEKLDNLFNLIADNHGFPIFETIEGFKKNVCQYLKADFLYDKDDIFIKEHMSFTDFEAYTEPHIETIFKAMTDVLKQAQVTHEQIDLICCTGGTSKVPQVKNRLLLSFGEEKIQTFKNFHSVINGLAEKALELSNE